MRVKTHLDFRNAMFFTSQDYLPSDIELPQREQPLMQGLHEHVYRQKRYVHQMPKAHRAYLLYQEKRLINMYIPFSQSFGCTLVCGSISRSNQRRPNR